MSAKVDPASHHPGAYRGKKGKGRLDANALLRLPVRPRRTFEQLWHHTGAPQGVTIAVMIIVLNAVLSLAIFWALSGWENPYWSRDDQFATARGLLSLDPLWTGVVLSLVNFLFTTALVYALVRAAGDAKKPDLGATYGLVGYAMFPAFCIGIVISLVVAWYGVEIAEYQETTGGLAEDYSGWDQFRMIYLLLAVIMLLWGLRTHTTATSVANDSEPKRTLALTLVAWVTSYMVFYTAIQVYLWLVEGEWADLPWLPVI